MLDLLDMMLEKVAVLTSGELWDNPADPAAQMELHLFRGGLPPKRSTPEQEQDHPFLVARLMNGGENVSQGRIGVRIMAGLHTHGTVDDGMVAIDRLLALLLKIPEERNYFPYTLEEDLAWHLGDPKDGQQAHPKYYLAVDLVFTRAPVMNNY